MSRSALATRFRCRLGHGRHTAPDDPKTKLKDKHLFTVAGEPWFWIAGLVKEGAFTMLTTSPGPDIAPYHDRQIVVLPGAQGLDWLDLSKPEAEILRALPTGSLSHEQAAGGLQRLCDGRAFRLAVSRNACSL